MEPPAPSETELTAVVGEDVRLELEASPTAGYLWHVREPLPGGLVLAHTGIAAGAGIGAPARQSFDLRATVEGEFVVMLDYGRPWESRPLRCRAYRIRAVAR